MRFTTMTSIAALLMAGTACAQDATLEAQDDAYAQDEATGEAYGYEVETDEGSIDPAYGEDTATAQTTGEDAYADEAVTDPYADTPYDDTAGTEADTYGQETAMAESPSLLGEPMDEEEVVTEARDEFTQADTDGDGQLSREEFLATMTTLAAAEAPVAATADPYADPIAGEDGYQTADASAQDPSEYLVAKFTEIAGDDEAVTLDELEEDRREDFQTADADGDGELEGEEAQTFAQLKTGQEADQDAAATTSTY